MSESPEAEKEDNRLKQRSDWNITGRQEKHRLLQLRLVLQCGNTQEVWFSKTQLKASKKLQKEEELQQITFQFVHA